MPYRVHRDPQGVPGVTLAGEPPYCHALAAGVLALEPALRQGVWLVMAFAVWSIPDVAAVQRALDLARRLGGRLSVGVRPYDDPLELTAWWPDADPIAPGPFWVLLRDGHIIGSLAGLPTDDELDALVRAATEP